MVGRNRLPAALDDPSFREAASAITGAMRAHDTTRNRLLKLLASSRRLSGDTERADDDRAVCVGILGSALWRFSALTERLLIAALQFAVTDDTDHLEAIRRFFLQPLEAYSIEELAALWRVHSDDVRDIYHDQLLRESAVTHGTSLRIAWADALGASITFNMLRPFDIERALGADFSRARTDMWRTVPILIHIPQFIADAVALEASTPATLALDLRIERFMLEHFASSAFRLDDSEAVRTRRLV